MSKGFSTLIFFVVNILVFVFLSITFLYDSLNNIYSTPYQLIFIVGYFVVVAVLIYIDYGNNLLIKFIMQGLFTWVLYHLYSMFVSKNEHLSLNESFYYSDWTPTFVTQGIYILLLSGYWIYQVKKYDYVVPPATEEEIKEYEKEKSYKDKPKLPDLD